MELAEYRRMHELEARHWWFRAKRRLVRELLARWGGEPGLALDVGCGTGIVLRHLPPGWRGVGVDPSPDALALCRERGLSRLGRAGATALPLADASADAVLALDIVEHVEDDVAALREIARILKPGRVALVTVPAFPFLWSEHDEALHHKRRYTRRALEERLARAGLAVRAGGYGYASAFPAAVALRLAKRGASALRRKCARRGVNGGPARPPVSDVRPLPRWLDGLAYRLLAWEVPLVRGGRLPVGLSLVYVVTPRGNTHAGPSTPSGRGAEGL